MKISAVIAEYNPFHNGHKYMLEKVKESSDAAVIIMSGGFVQRGGIAVTDKWTRAGAALLNGADLVIELPVTYALNTAQRFAHGGVYLADAIGADELCFGSESADIQLLGRAADIIVDEPAEVSEKIKLFTAQGMNYPSARSRAYSGLIEDDLLSMPNNILAVEYICALKRLKSKLIPRAVKRHAVGHDSDTAAGSFASASAIRERLISGKSASHFLPPNVDASFVPYDLMRLDGAILYALRNYSPKKLSEINDVAEGLENRIIREAVSSVSVSELAEKIKTKRYTRSRINRIILSAFLELTKELCALNPSYIRVLGMNSTGIRILHRAKKECTLPIITKTADFKSDDPIFRADLRASEAFSLCAPDEPHRAGGADFRRSPIVL